MGVNTSTIEVLQRVGVFDTMLELDLEVAWPSRFGDREPLSVPLTHLTHGELELRTIRRREGSLD